jgi:hypothetical protein
MAHGGVMVNGVQKTYPDFFDALSYLIWIEIKIAAQSHQDISRSTLAAGCPVPMFGNFRPMTSNDKGGRG